MLLTNPDITKMLDVDTCHISPKDSELLSESAKYTQVIVPGTPKLVVYEYDCGFFVYVNVDEAIDEDELRKVFSGALVRLLVLAQAHGCWFLHLDADGPCYPDELEMFEW